MILVGCPLRVGGVLRLLFAAVAMPVALAGPSASASGVLIPSFLPKGSLPFTAEQLAALGRVEAQSVRWSDIRGWRPLGARWAAALDGAGRVIAIYDMSVSSAAGPLVGSRIAVLGGPDFNLARVRELLSGAAASGDKKTRDRARKAIQLLDRAPEHLSRGMLPDDWYKSVPWTPRALAAFGSQSGPPARFALSDIDYDGLVPSRRLFKAGLRYLTRFGIDFSRLTLTRQGDGSYVLDCLGATGGAGKTAAPRPLLIADLTSIYAGFFETVEWTIGSSVIGYLVGLIPNPVASALVGTALDRYFAFRNGVIDLHREAAREMILAAVGHEPLYSAFSPLTPTEVRRAGVYLYLGQTSFFTLWNWVFKGAEGGWRFDMKTEAERSTAAHRWLVSHGRHARGLNPRYALDSDPHKLYLLNHVRWLGPAQEPVPGIDYDHLANAITLRVGMETASTAVDFATHFVPIFGGAISTVFDWIFRSPVMATKDFEARLTAHLEERERVSGEDWERELAILDTQRVNPLELPRAQARALTVEIARSLGIHPGSAVGPDWPQPPEEHAQSLSNALE